MIVKREYHPSLISALLGLALYAITLGGTYVYDDAYIAQLDPRLQYPGRWGEYFTRAYFPGAPDRLFRPLTSFSFAIEWYLHGDRPWIMHLVSILLYAGVCALVAELARRLAGLRAAWIAGILFAIHPVHVEPVAYLVGRADLICSLGILGAIILFISQNPMTHKRALAIWGCMVVAILSKEPGMLLPILLIPFVPVRRQRSLIPKQAEKPGIQSLLLLLSWTLAGYIVFREQSRVFKFSWDPAFMDWTVNPLGIAPLVDRWLIPFSLVGRYLQLLLVPWRLSIDYIGWIGTQFKPADRFFYLGITAVLSWWIALILAIRRRAYPVVAALLCFVLSYAMVSNFGIVIGAIFGERLIFLPSVFFILLLSFALQRLPAKWIPAVLTPILLLAVLRVETYAWRWNNALRLYTLCADEQPSSARLRMLMMDRLRDQGDYAAAARAGALGRAGQPDYWRIWYYSALVAAERQRFDEADQLIAHGLTMQHTDLAAFAALRAKIQSGEFNAATTHPASTQN